MPIRPSRLALGAALTLAALGAALGAAPAAAQVSPVNPFSFGVSGGALVPTGDFGDSFETGFAVNGIVGLRAPTLPVSFRGEVGYSRNGVKGDGDGADANLRIISGVANVVLGFSPGPTAVVRPYLIGGLGVYNYRGSLTIDEGTILDSRAPRRAPTLARVPAGPTARAARDVTISGDAETRLGLNGGAGVELPLSGISVFGEVRFQSIFAEGGNLNAVPITVGIRF